MLILLPSSDVNVSSSLRTWAWLSLPWISPQSQLIYPKYIPSLGKNFLSWKTRASTPIVYCLSPSLHSAWQYEIVSFVSSFDLRLSAMFSSVQSLSQVRLFVTPWTVACQASLSITNSRSSPKPMFIESMMPSNHLLLCHPLLLLPSIFPSIRVFSNESVLPGGQSIGVSASTSVLPTNKE